MNREELEAAIAAQESLRGQVADVVLDTTIAALRSQLTALDAGGRRRRQATILFADVSGFTAMAEALDAEDVSDMMNEVWARLDAVVAEQGGRIDKHIGDALMAIWGTDATREDDPERAVRAALGLQSAMAQLRADTGIDLRLRVGVNTGPVLLGSVGSTSEFTAMGDAVNLASRLEHAAPIDGVLISHDTYRHVKGVFTVRVQQPIEVKGKSRPVRCYLVDDERPRAFRLGTRGVEGVETQMVGRDDEIRLLRSELGAMLGDGSARSICVVGEAGLGKSRLLYEFEDWLHLVPTDVRLFKARADQQHAAEPLFLIRDLLLSRFEIAEDEAIPSAVEKLSTGVRALAPALTEREVELITALAGLDSPLSSTDPAKRPPAFLEQMSTALATFMSRVAADLPVVVLLEDLHWADASSLDVIELVTEQCSDARLFTVLLSRPGGFEQHAVASRPSTRLIRLAPLSGETTRALARDVLQNVTDLPENVLQEISATADGNPFFVEELIKAMVDDETIAITDDEWKVDLDRLERTRSPATITAVLQSRLDRLSSSERAVLECAAVVGRTFWDEAISDAAECLDAPLDDPGDALSSLERKELVFRMPSSRFLDAHQYIFKHALLHEVAYERVLKADRARLHRGVADWYVRRDDSDTLSATISAHFDAAGATADAALWHARAGRYAARRFAPNDAIAHLTQALDADDLDNDIRYWVLEELSGVLTLLGRHADGIDSATEMLAVATTHHDLDGQVNALLERSFHLTRLGRLDDALAACRRAGDIAATGRAGTEIQARIHIELGWILLRLGHLDPAIESSRTALTIADRISSASAHMRAHSLLGVALQAAGDLPAAELHLNRALEIAQQEHNTYFEAGCRINLGVVASHRAEHGLAVDQYEAALKIVRGIGDLDQEALALNNLGSEHISLGDYDIAVAQLTEAVRLFEAADAAEHTSETHSLLARARLGNRDSDRALARTRVAVEMAKRTGSPDHLGNAYLTLGAVAAVTGRPEAADGAEELHTDAWVTKGIAILTAAGLELELASALRQIAGVIVDAGHPLAASDIRRQASELRRTAIASDEASMRVEGD